MTKAIGIDIDGTITVDPGFFSMLSKKCREEGWLVHIVSSRSREGRQETLHELAEQGIIFDELYLLPSIEKAQRICPHDSLDWFLRHQWLKVEYAERNQIALFVDDDPKVLRLFDMFATDVEAISVQDRHMISDRLASG